MWKDTACVVCDDTNKCVTTGCADLAYPGKGGSGSTPPPAAAANSSIILFIVGALISLCTILI